MRQWGAMLSLLGSHADCLKRLLQCACCATKPAVQTLQACALFCCVRALLSDHSTGHCKSKHEWAQAGEE